MLDWKICRYCRRSAVCLPIPEDQLGRFHSVSDPAIPELRGDSEVPVWCHPRMGDLMQTETFDVPRALVIAFQLLFRREKNNA